MSKVMQFIRPDEFFSLQRNTALPNSMKFQFLPESEDKYLHGVEKCKRKFRKIAKNNKEASLVPARFHLGISAKKVDFVKKKGKLCDFDRADSVLDKFGGQLVDTRPCPKEYEQTIGYFANFCNNRLTVYDTELWDGKMRPIYSLNNFSEHGQKSDIGRFSKMVDKPHIIKCFDWIGDAEETQLIVAEQSGMVFRVCLQQRMIVAAWKDGKFGTKQIATHYKSAVFATLDDKNTIRLYTTGYLETKVQSLLVGELQFSKKIDEMQWFGEKLFFVSENALFEVPFDLSKLQKIEPTVATPVYYPNRKKAKKVIKLKAKQIHTFNKKHNIVKFKRAGDLFSQDVGLLQCKNGTIIEYNLEERKVANVVESPHLNSKFGFALHPTRRVLVTSDGGGKCIILNYPTGREFQSINNRGLGLGKGGQCVHWSLGKFKDALIVTSGKTMTRFLPKNSKLLHTKRANSNCFTQGLPYNMNVDGMDQSNVDHNHRNNQFFANNDAISRKFSTVGAMKKKVTTREKVMQYNIKYYKCMSNPKNVKRFAQADKKDLSSIRPSPADWVVPDKVDISDLSRSTNVRFSGETSSDSMAIDDLRYTQPEGLIQELQRQNESEDGESKKRSQQTASIKRRKKRKVGK